MPTLLLPISFVRSPSFVLFCFVFCAEKKRREEFHVRSILEGDDEVSSIYIIYWILIQITKPDID